MLADILSKIGLKDNYIRCNKKCYEKKHKDFRASQPQAFPKKIKQLSDKRYQAAISSL